MCAQVVPAAGLLLLPYLAGNSVAALLLTTARLALATSPFAVVADTPRAPTPLDHGRAAPFGTDGDVTPESSPSSSSNGAGPTVVVQRTQSSSNGASAPLREPDLDAGSSRGGSGVLKPGNGLQPFQESGSGRVAQGTASWGGAPKACIQQQRREQRRPMVRLRGRRLAGSMATWHAGSICRPHVSRHAVALQGSSCRTVYL